MGELQLLFAAVLALFQVEFTIYGITLSLWQVFVFTTVAGIAAWVLGEMFLGD